MCALQLLISRFHACLNVLSELVNGAIIDAFRKLFWKLRDNFCQNLEGTHSVGNSVRLLFHERSTFVSWSRVTQLSFIDVQVNRIDPKPQFRILKSWTITTRQIFQFLRAKFIPNWRKWPTIFAFGKDSNFARISRSCGWKVDLIWPKCPPVQIQARSQLGGGIFENNNFEK